MKTTLYDVFVEHTKWLSCQIRVTSGSTPKSWRHFKNYFYPQKGKSEFCNGSVVIFFLKQLFGLNFFFFSIFQVSIRRCCGSVLFKILDPQKRGQNDFFIFFRAKCRLYRKWISPFGPFFFFLNFPSVFSQRSSRIPIGFPRSLIAPSMLLPPRFNCIIFTLKNSIFLCFNRWNFSPRFARWQKNFPCLYNNIVPLLYINPLSLWTFHISPPVFPWRYLSKFIILSLSQASPLVFVDQILLSDLASLRVVFLFW